MIQLFILLYFISIIILVCDKEFKDLKEKYPSERLIFAYALISLSLLPLVLFIALKAVEGFRWLKTELKMWWIKREVNKLCKKHGIKERL